MARRTLLVVVLVAIVLGAVSLPAAAQTSDPDQARQIATAFVANHATDWTIWKDASLGNTVPLFDLEGRLIAHAFPVVKSSWPVGNVVVGSALYHWIILEAGDSPLPDLTPTEIKTILERDLKAAATDS